MVGKRQFFAGCSGEGGERGGGGWEAKALKEIGDSYRVCGAQYMELF